MNKTLEESLFNVIKFHNISLLKLLFEQYEPAQSLINKSFALSCEKKIINQSHHASFGCCPSSSTYDNDNNRNILNFIADYIDSIDDKSLNFIIDERYSEVINKIIGKSFFNIKQLNYNHLIKLISFNNIKLCEIICDLDKTIIDVNVLSSIIRYWPLTVIMEFLAKYGIKLLDYNNSFNIFIEGAINSYNIDKITFVLDTFNITLDKYKHPTRIYDTEIIKVLLKYGYGQFMEDFDFDDVVDVDVLYKMVEKVNNPNWMFAVILSKINKIENAVYELQPTNPDY